MFSSPLATEPSREGPFRPQQSLRSSSPHSALSVPTVRIAASLTGDGSRAVIGRHIRSALNASSSSRKRPEYSTREQLLHEFKGGSLRSPPAPLRAAAGGRPRGANAGL